METDKKHLKQQTFLNYMAIATIALGLGFIIGEQTDQRATVGKIVALFLIAGFACIPLVYHRSLQRWEQLKKYNRNLCDDLE